MKSQWRPYKDRLSIDEAVEGINLARRNAERLLDDAELLLSASRYPSAAALAILSIEERGKEGLIRSILASSAEADLKINWRRFRSHTDKNLLWLAPIIAGQQGATLASIAAITSDPELEHAKILDVFKQFCFYVDLVSSGTWGSPEKTATPEITDKLMFCARVLRRPEAISRRELELWLEAATSFQPESVDAAVDWLMQLENRLQEEGLRAQSPNGTVQEELGPTGPDP